MLSIRKSLLDHFGLKEAGIFDSPTVEMFASELREGIRAREMTALIGPTGAGKNHLLRRVKRQMGRQSTDGDDEARLAWVHVHDLTPRRMKIQNVINAVIFDLTEGEASLRSNFEARTRQCERLLFQARRRGRQPVIVIDDAHRLSPDSFAVLKRLREAEFNGVPIRPAVVLVGWPRLGGMLDRHKEVAERTERLVLCEEDGWMTPPERVAYLEAVFREAISESTRWLLAQEHRVPMSLTRAVKDAMKEARALGHEVVDERTVAPRLADLYDQSAASQREIAREADLSASTVNRTIKADRQGEDAEEAGPVRRAVERINQRKTKQQKAEPVSA
jgi:type II secretory pathway predicted ATPase ExeA